MTVGTIKAFAVTPTPDSFTTEIRRIEVHEHAKAYKALRGGSIFELWRHDFTDGERAVYIFAQMRFMAAEALPRVVEMLDAPEPHTNPNPSRASSAG
jgi:hypothetical protein